MEFDESKYYLGKLCPKRHEYNQSGLSLRYINHTKNCVVCARTNSKRAKDKPDYKESSRWAAKKHNYGITREQYNQMLEDQNYCCAICGKQNNNLYVDHDHETGKVRGLLCSYCNRSLAGLGDSLSGVLRAVKYLER